MHPILASNPNFRISIREYFSVIKVTLMFYVKTIRFHSLFIARAKNKIKRKTTHAGNKGVIVTQIIKLLNKLLIWISEDLDFTPCVPLV